MSHDSIDELARRLATTGSRRQVLGSFLKGTIGRLFSSSPPAYNQITASVGVGHAVAKLGPNKSLAQFAITGWWIGNMKYGGEAVTVKLRLNHLSIPLFGHIATITLGTMWVFDPFTGEYAEFADMAGNVSNGTYKLKDASGYTITFTKTPIVISGTATFPASDTEASITAIILLKSIYVSFPILE